MYLWRNWSALFRIEQVCELFNSVCEHDFNNLKFFVCACWVNRSILDHITSVNRKSLVIVLCWIGWTDFHLWLTFSKYECLSDICIGEIESRVSQIFILNSREDKCVFKRIWFGGCIYDRWTYAPTTTSIQNDTYYIHLFFWAWQELNQKYTGFFSVIHFLANMYIIHTIDYWNAKMCGTWKPFY